MPRKSSGAHDTPSPRQTDALIVDGSTRQALVTTRVLGRSGLHVATAEAIDLCDPYDALAFSSRWSVYHELLPSYHDQSSAYASALLNLVRQWPTRVIVPSMDGSIASLRPWRSFFESEDVALALASESALEVANDKQRTLAVAAVLGIASPRTVAIADPKNISDALAEVG